MGNEFFAIAGEHINDRNLYHCVASRFLKHRCSCYIYQNLSSKRRIVYLHIK